MPERLRGWTRNPLCIACVGSSPAIVDTLSFLFFSFLASFKKVVYIDTIENFCHAKRSMQNVAMQNVVFFFWKTQRFACSRNSNVFEPCKRSIFGNSKRSMQNVVFFKK